jgi:hypothetical protein
MGRTVDRAGPLSFWTLVNVSFGRFPVSPNRRGLLVDGQQF